MGKRWIRFVKAFSVFFSLSFNMELLYFSVSTIYNEIIRFVKIVMVKLGHRFGSLLLLLCISLLSHSLFDSILEHFRQIIPINLHMFSNDNIPFLKFEYETSFTSILPTISSRFCLHTVLIHTVLKWKSIYSCVQR